MSTQLRQIHNAVYESVNTAQESLVAVKCSKHYAANEITTHL